MAVAAMHCRCDSDALSTGEHVLSLNTTITVFNVMLLEIVRFCL